jgi:hypothetical protein
MTLEIIQKLLIKLLNYNILYIMNKDYRPIPYNIITNLCIIFYYCKSSCFLFLPDL